MAPCGWHERMKGELVFAKCLERTHGRGTAPGLHPQEHIDLHQTSKASSHGDFRVGPTLAPSEERSGLRAGLLGGDLCPRQQERVWLRQGLPTPDLCVGAGHARKTNREI